LLDWHGARRSEFAVGAVGRQHDDDDDRQEEHEVSGSEHREQELGDGGPQRPVSTERQHRQVVAGDADRTRQTHQHERHDECEQLRSTRNSSLTRFCSEFQNGDSD